MMPIYNFSAGPAMLPQAVMQRAQAEFLDWHGSGMSVMEMSHRGKEYMSIAEKAEADLRKLMNIPNNYKVLFLQGGASQQFGAIPLNLTRPGEKTDYFNTGAWSKKAIEEASRYTQVNVVAKASNEIPDVATWNLSDDAVYVHYTPNETIGGLEFPFIPDVGDKILVADMSSTILSRPVDVAKFGVIYAGAQKNIGPAGLTLVIVRDDLLGRAREDLPVMLNWKIHADNDSMYNTPSTYAWYIAGLVFEWLLEIGGLQAMAEINQRKANLLYAAIDSSPFYANPVKVSDRSWMNIPFTLAEPGLDKQFLVEAKQVGLVTLAGHRSVGGMRASIYNAMPEAGVKALVDFMKGFELRNA